jgi:hypothetical protein
MTAMGTAGIRIYTIIKAPDAGFAKYGFAQHLSADY